MPDLRDDQSEALDALRDAVRDNKLRICMQAPTGWGKTMLTCALVESALAKSKKVLFTVPTISLIEQTVSMFAAQGIVEVGVIQAANPLYDWNQPIQVASVQTLAKRTVPEADVILIDECHKWFKFYERLMHKDTMPQFEKVPIIGLSATPWTKGMGSWFTTFHRASTTQEMIDAGHLSPFKVYAPSHPDLTGVRTVGDDYDEAELSKRMQGKLVADAVDTWIKLAEGRPTLCYAVDCAHAKALQMKFQAAGIPCGYQDAFTSDNDKIVKKTGAFIEGRINIKRKFHTGEYPVVVNVETLTTGIDWDVRCISMCRPTKSDMLFVQTIGRGLRNADGKDHCLILDHSDNHLRLGYVTDVDASYEGLHVGKTPEHSNRTEGIRLPKECPQCAYLKPPKLAQCPACGFVAKVVSRIKPETGELVEFTRELKRKPPPPPDPLVVETMEEKAVFFSELKYYCARQGYAPGWAMHKYKEKTGVWPNHPTIKFAPPAKWIRPETVNYIKSRFIAHANRRKEESGYAWRS